MKIAIQGHPTKGKEVIQILEGLGGKNTKKWRGAGNIRDGFFIDNDGIIEFDNLPIGYKLYTLEEFEKEFPFKIGETVITTLNHVGTIIGIVNGKYKVLFKEDNSLIAPRRLKLYKEMKEERNITLTLDKAKEWYKKGGDLKQVALQAFTEEELNPLPRSWEEFCEKYSKIDDKEYFIDSNSSIMQVTAVTPNHCRLQNSDKNICPSKKSAEAHLAMIQLEQLRDCWRQGWKPDLNDDQQTKYCVVCYHEEFKINILYSTSRFLSFPTHKMAEEFLKYFKDLIEKARDLI